MAREKRREQRLSHGFYMRVLDESTHALLGYISQVSQRGFRLDCLKPLPVEKDYTLRLEYTSVVEDKPYIIFTARVVWCRPDEIIPNEYYAGFTITAISTFDQGIYQGIVEKYGKFEHKW